MGRFKVQKALFHLIVALSFPLRGVDGCDTRCWCPSRSAGWTRRSRLLVIRIDLDCPVSLEIEYGERADVANTIDVEREFSEKVDDRSRAWWEGEK